MVNDLASAHSEIQDLDTELALTGESVSSLENEVTAHEEEYDNLQVEYDGLQPEIDDLMAEYEALGGEYETQDALLSEYAAALDSANGYMAIVLGLYTHAFTGDGLSDQATIDAVHNFVDQTGDAELQGKLDTWEGTPWNRNLASEILTHSFLKIEEALFIE